jgi:hypothetical protein
MGRCELARELSNFGQQAWGNQDRTPVDEDLARRRGVSRLGGARLTAYQVTSPAPVRTFATRASMKRRSESRLR